MSSGKNPDDVQPEYDLAKLGKGTRGKYFKRYQAGTSVGVIDDGDQRSRRKPKKQGRR